MKTKNPFKDDPALSRLLREWSPDATLPPRFQDRVWAQIAKEEPQPAFSLWTAWNHWLAGVLPRPRMAFAYITALLLVGALSGFLEARAASARSASSASSRYLQSVDPYQAVGSNP